MIKIVLLLSFFTILSFGDDYKVSVSCLEKHTVMVSSKKDKGGYVTNTPKLIDPLRLKLYIDNKDVSMSVGGNDVIQLVNGGIASNGTMSFLEVTGSGNINLYRFIKNRLIIHKSYDLFGLSFTSIQMIFECKKER